MIDVTCEMPRYQSHKQVWALKIKSIVRDGEGENRETDGSAVITPEEDGYAPFKVDWEYMSKHKPQAGGYYVAYKDGHKSFCPAKEFEDGNTLIPKAWMVEVLAKFRCNGATPTDGEQTNVNLGAVTDGCEENKSFSRWTPAGTVSLVISNETPAAEFFKPGKEYYLTFKEAE